MKLPRRQKLALNLLMGLGIITAIVCIIRTAFSYETKQEDETWAGVPNALCRILEINICIIAACMPMLRPLWNLSIRKWRERFGPEAATTVRTPMSRLQWYRPPSRTPWYRRIGRHFEWAPRPPISQTSSTQSMMSRHSGGSRNPNNEKGTLPRAAPHVVKPVHPSQWPQHYEKPENVTWAKDPGSPKMSDSLDLPLQGVRNSEWVEPKHVDWGGFRFDRGFE